MTKSFCVRWKVQRDVKQNKESSVEAETRDEIQQGLAKFDALSGEWNDGKSDFDAVLVAHRMWWNFMRLRNTSRAADKHFKSLSFSDLLFFYQNYKHFERTNFITLLIFAQEKNHCQ